jgi:hypothetical protein
MEIILLFEVRLMTFLGVWDVLLVSMIPICVCKRINLGCDFVLGMMGCFKRFKNCLCKMPHEKIMRAQQEEIQRNLIHMMSIFLKLVI